MAVVEMIKCYSCGEDPDFAVLANEQGYVVHTNPEMIQRCRDHRHKVYSLDEKPKRPEVNVYDIASTLMNEYHFKTLDKTNEILFYKDGVYREDGEYIIQKKSRKLAEDVRNHHINEIKGIIRDETGYVSREEFDKEEHVINTKNFVFDLKSGTTREQSPDYLSRVKIPVYYDPNATCPRFDKFLETSLESDEKKIRTVLEMMALCLIKDNGLVQKAFMNTGKGSNGKSILFGILFAMLGKENVSAKTIHDFERNHFASSALEGKLANICADVGSKGITETETLKKIITGDPIDCERKFMEGYSFTPYATLIFSANEIPEVSDESDGFARRFELIEWTKSFYGDERDNTVKTIRKDPKELSGIFNKITKVARELLQSQCLKYESTVEDAKIKWLKKSDSVQRFADEMLDVGTELFVPKVNVFSAYIAFCKKTNLTPLKDREFNSKMAGKGFLDTQKKISGINTKIWGGCQIRETIQAGNATLA